MTDYLLRSFDWNDPSLVNLYDEVPLWSAPFGLLLLDRLRLRPNLSVLDLGCGPGFPLIELAQRLGGSCRVFGVDPWGAALARARQRITRLQVRHVHLIQGDGLALPLPAASIDLIVSNLGLNNFSSPANALAEAARVARPAARIALTTNLRGHMAEFYAVYEQTLHDLDRPELIDRLRDHINHRATALGTQRLLEIAGFRVRRIDEQALILRYLDGTAFFNHAFIQMAFMEAWRGVLPDSLEKEVFTELEARLNRLAQRQGELALTVPIAYIEAERRA